MKVNDLKPSAEIGIDTITAEGLEPAGPAGTRTCRSPFCFQPPLADEVATIEDLPIRQQRSGSLIGSGKWRKITWFDGKRLADLREPFLRY